MHPKLFKYNKNVRPCLFVCVLCIYFTLYYWTRDEISQNQHMKQCINLCFSNFDICSSICLSNGYQSYPECSNEIEKFPCQFYYVSTGCSDFNRLSAKYAVLYYGCTFASTTFTFKDPNESIISRNIFYTIYYTFLLLLYYYFIIIITIVDFWMKTVINDFSVRNVKAAAAEGNFPHLGNHIMIRHIITTI